MKVKDQAALITGGASGLGLATAEALVAAGAKVTLLDMNEAKLKIEAARLGCHAELCNVADEASVQGAIERAEAVNGLARVVVNCAGIGTPARAIGRNGPMPIDAFTKILNVNLVGTFNVIRLAVFRMQDAEAFEDGERGVVINTASVAAFDGQIGQPAYAASKAAVVGMTLPLAREFSRIGVRVMTIAPGVFETPMVSGELTEQVQAALAAAIPFPSRLGKPEEFAKLAMAIIDTSFLNGECIRLDGAQRMAPK